MHLYVQGEISVGGLLKVETGRGMYLGEVAAIWPQPDSGYTAALMLVEHSLTHAAEKPRQRSAV
jgi:hypothetical protein